MNIKVWFYLLKSKCKKVNVKRMLGEHYDKKKNIIRITKN